jgi:hypothetical protein
MSKLRHRLSLYHAKWTQILPLLLICLLGLGLRFLDLTDPPLDFTPWRQLRSATIARGMYYDMLPTEGDTRHEIASSLGKSFEKLEPEIFERIVALSYLVMGEESLPIARVWAIIFWMIGGFFLYDLSRRISSATAALASLSFYMVLPFSVVVSRSFLPDVLMTMWVIISVYSLYQWIENHTWKWAFLYGLISGLAILTKVFAVFPISLTALFLTLSSWKPKDAIRDRQVWLFSILVVIIPASYYLIQTFDRAGSYLSYWVFAFSDLLTTRSFYTLWMDVLDRLIGFLPISLALTGALIAAKRNRMLLFGLWAGYLFVGLSVPSLIYSHTYYNTQLIPIVALSLAPLADLVVREVKQQSAPIRVLFIITCLYALGYPALEARRQLLAKDYREEIKGWIQMGEEIPSVGKLIGLTHDYNNRLAYYGWKDVAQWPHLSDYEMLSLAGGNYDPNDNAIIEEFTRRTNGYDYFIVTLFGELDSQPMLKSILQENYPYITGEGYILYNLREPKSRSSPSIP